MRAGDSPETIAAEMGWPLDRVERYAGPPLAERENIAALASATELRRSGRTVTLAESIESVAGTDDLAWDARRRPEDGRWVVVISAGGKPVAAWTYDIAGRSVSPLDDEARRLMGVEAAAVPTRTRESGTEPVAHPSTRDTAILSAVRPDRAEHGGREPSTREQSGRPHLVSVPSPPNEPDREPEPNLAEIVDIADVIEAADIADDAYLAEAAEDETHERASAAADDDARIDALADLPPAAGMQETLAIPTPKKAAKRSPRKRASVPSWDEILFGSKSTDD